jgi:hypothetical protein
LPHPLNVCSVGCHPPGPGPVPLPAPQSYDWQVSLHQARRGGDEAEAGGCWAAAHQPALLRGGEGRHHILIPLFLALLLYQAS